ncbi:MAG: Asp-tRNA(Asn)/Glu-tRNA(Gln) amidotransferase subunit GatC [Saprospiraceae bacterium]|nr:Asp-tRNA(Asn)/Glu-tRNA(Gln) amidotransferase subunit GatC [Saprospiraceae bacterium]
MKVDEALILNLEKLARLSLEADERVRLSADLEEILQMVAKLEELNLEGVEPLRHMSPVKHQVRQDKEEAHLTIEEALQNAPKYDKPFFTVPKVIKR